MSCLRCSFSCFQMRTCLSKLTFLGFCTKSLSSYVSGSAVVEARSRGVSWLTISWLRWLTWGWMRGFLGRKVSCSLVSLKSLFDSCEAAFPILYYTGGAGKSQFLAWLTFCSGQEASTFNYFNGALRIFFKLLFKHLGVYRVVLDEFPDTFHDGELVFSLLHLCIRRHPLVELEAFRAVLKVMWLENSVVL